MTLNGPGARLIPQVNDVQGININELHTIRRPLPGPGVCALRWSGGSLAAPDYSCGAAAISSFMATLAAALRGAALSTPGRVAYSRSMGVTPADSALMLRYKDGDIQAFETLYRRHNHSLYRYLLRLSLNQQTAEDLFQEVWSKIVKARHRYRPTAKFTTFLYRVAHNCFIDHVRRNNRHLQSIAVDPDTSPDPGDEPDVRAERSLARRRLEAALLTIPFEQRDAFLLHEEAGLSIDTIAEISGVKRETIKSRLRYASKKLKAAFDEPAIKTQRSA
jgi:RNA polymerase sigma-70 factor (ECF subfamily)